MLLVQLLVARRSQSYHPLPPSSRPTSHLQHHINQSSSSSSSRLVATRSPTNIPPRPLLPPSTSALHQTAFPRLTSYYSAHTQAPDMTASAAATRDEEDGPRAALPSRSATPTTRDRTRRRSPSGSPVGRAVLRTPSPVPLPPLYPPPSPSDRQGGRHALDFWKMWQRGAAGGDDGGGLRRRSSSSPLSTSQTRRRPQITRGAAERRVRYSERGSPTLAIEADGAEEESCLIGAREGAAIYGEARRGRVGERDGLRRAVGRLEWEGIRTGVDVDGGFDGGSGEFERRTLETQREWERRRTEKVSMGYRWEEWDKTQVQKRAESYWIANDPTGVSWANEETSRQDWQPGDNGWSPELSVQQGTPFESDEDEWEVEKKGNEDGQTVVRRAVDSASPASPITGKARVISENWESYSRTPSEEVKPQDHTPGPGSRASSSPDESSSSEAENDGTIPQAAMILAQTQSRINRFTRPRRLTGDPTPNRLAAEKGSNKHFRKINDDVGSPTIQTLREGVLPLSDGFQINIRSEQESDPFMEPLQHESKDSMDELDSYLARIVGLYANGDERSRRLLLQNLQSAIAAQEALGSCTTMAESGD
ncbi:hypothetical protein DIS24_g306 [Lasiodiplodia hormozganensis]|uniref:Uncharacterized protein n=1 Tax=Lasiodiplodia hormozganensis TaxID=869390 RepID=A0AA39Z6X8_9PEZI|nr:hypothetical protein DIS24_g306 [Lasiodiplodia hormozganensis]